ncbi:MAG: phospholipid carrier-dependent glycosyltransferase [Verrucomicrobiota bacterium]
MQNDPSIITPATDSSAVNGSQSGRAAWLAATVVVLLIGIALRVCPTSSFTRLGFDENLYRVYVTMLSKVGLSNYPDIVQAYNEHQSTLTYSILPPMRFLYIFTSWVWKRAFYDTHLLGLPGVDDPMVTSLMALHDVACFFSCLALVTAFLFSLRLGGRTCALAVLALMACAPTQIHMAQHALVDGFFAFWALLTVWLLWENLKKPDSPFLLAGYTLALACMVITKENSFFVFFALLVLLTANRWLKFGTVTPRLGLLTFAGPLLGVVILVFLAGGVQELIGTYQQSVSKNFTLPYAIKTGDGPWYRYFVDLMLVSPLVLILAIGGIFRLKRDSKPELYLTLFIAGSYLIMCNLKYGLNLRYANMWDMPLRYLAFGQLAAVCASFGRRKELLLALSVIALCAFDLHQYWVLMVRYPLYELVSEGLLRALLILK